MNIQELNEMIKELHSVADELEGRLPAINIQFFRDFIEHNELGIGVEILLEQIYENDIVLSKMSYYILKNASKAMKVDDDLFIGVKHNE